MRQDQNKNLLSTQFYIMHWNIEHKHKTMFLLKHRGWMSRVRIPNGIIGIVFDE